MSCIILFSPGCFLRAGLVFGYDVPVKFSVVGPCSAASVHLTGYFQPGPDDDNSDDEDDEDGKSFDHSLSATLKLFYNTRSQHLLMRLQMKKLRRS
jgi:hypothetical protein